MTAEPRDQRWNFRVNRRTDELITEAAALSGISKTAFVEESAVRRAEEMIAERRAIRLSPEAFDAFVASLESPPRAIPQLVKLFSQTPDIAD